MKYFIDTEFMEGFHKPLFGKRRHFIDLISIGIVAEDGRQYYAISNEFNPKDADQWVKDNIISKLGNKYKDTFTFDESGYPVYFDNWKPNKQIAKEIIEFIYPAYKEGEQYLGRIDMFEDKNLDSTVMRKYVNDVEFYAYYADYDWVLFCSLFGRMIDLPKGFPMYCKDLKQSKDDIWDNKKDQYGKMSINVEGKEINIKSLDEHPNYPKQENEHNALDDARWNYRLYKFLQNI